MAEEYFDLIIVGAGIVGASTAREASLRGLKVLLLDKGDFGGGTSHRSTKLIHGGLRYLEQMQFKMVFESTTERARLREIAPHLTRPQSFLLPVYKTDKYPLAIMDMGVWLYDTLSLFSSYKIHKRYGQKKIKKMEPELHNKDLKGGVIFYDYRTDDARLTLEMVLAAEDKGSVVKNYHPVTEFLRGPSQRIEGVFYKNIFTGETFSAKSKIVLVCAGAWTDRIRKNNNFGTKNLLRPTKGVHIVFKKEDFPLNHAVVLRAPQDNRATFAIPWPDHTIVGTTDTDFEEDPDNVHITPSDTDYLLELANFYFPALNLKKEQILSSWAGLRPLFATEEGVSESQVSREHEIIYDYGNHLITVVGGKLTTCRRMAIEILEEAKKHGNLVFQNNKRIEEDLPGGKMDPEDFPPDSDWCSELSEEYNIPNKTVETLIWRYGSKVYEVLTLCKNVGQGLELLVPEQTCLIGEIHWAIKFEKIQRLEDFLIRRTSLSLTTAEMALGAVPKLAEIMAEVLSWDEERLDMELKNYKEYVQKALNFY